KVICNSEACPLSQFMHAECFHQWEETILGHLLFAGRARSWSEKQRRQNLWTKRGYDLAYRACACACRHGHLRKDLNWVASTPQQSNRMRHSSASSSVSVDQGYISESPGTGEAPYVFSPPSTRMHFSFHNVGQPRPSNGFGLHAPSTSPLPESPPRGFFQPDPVQPSLAPSDQMWFPQQTHSFPQENNWIEQAKNAQLLQAMRQKEQSEMAKRELNKMILDMMNMGENKTQSVLPRQHINPYHIKMEGEGYGSDDLRNFILSSLSVAKCSQMNCVLCGVDLPVYDHFPLIDGTMFLSPEKNERSTKNCFKYLYCYVNCTRRLCFSFQIKIEGKYEYVHAACIRCLGGMHNIVCRMCDVRWEGSHHQLGTLYMYDIFAANPCCQKRLCCKQ
uniref:Uncharacterized protein n=1 Tax=Ciona savignyi TaxID=51511 RepID=H2YMT2_CIOSA